MFASLYCQAKTIRVAVIDTGYDFYSTWPNIESKGLAKPKLCNGGHIDLTRDESDKEYLKDNHGHGTHIAGIIARYSEDTNYCLIIIKFYDPKIKTANNLNNTIKAFRWAIEQHADIINYSAGGTDYSKEEKAAITEALNKFIRVVVAAGNESSNIDEKGKHYYPAYYSRSIESVGNIMDNGKLGPKSNYGRSVACYRPGTDVFSLLPGNSYGVMTGTSQATAIRSSEIVKELDKLNKLDKFDARKYLKGYKITLAS